jgi:hypothetical protein
MRPLGTRALYSCARSLILLPALLPGAVYAQAPERSTTTFQQRLEGQPGAPPVFARPLYGMARPSPPP